MLRFCTRWLVLAPSVARANGFTATLTLTPTNATAVQQTAQSPCIFGNAPCNQQNNDIGTANSLGHDFPWEATPDSASDNGSGGPLILGDLADDTTWGNGGGEANDYDSARILVNDLEKVVNSDRFIVGIDVNQAADASGIYTLVQFVMQIFNGATDALIDSWTFTNDASATPPTGEIPASNNGTGFSDAILNFTSLDLDHYANTDYVIFKTTWSANTDGQDQYFINSATRNPRPTMTTARRAMSSRSQRPSCCWEAGWSAQVAQFGAGAGAPRALTAASGSRRSYSAGGLPAPLRKGRRRATPSSIRKQKSPAERLPRWGVRSRVVSP